MFRLTMGATLMAAAFFTTNVMAEQAGINPKPYDSLRKCFKAALAKHDDKIVKVELKSEKHRPLYEFDIESADGTTWDVT